MLYFLKRLVNSRKTFAEINTIAGIKLNLSIFYFRDSPVTIPFYFKQPILIVKWVFGNTGQHGLNKCFNFLSFSMTDGCNCFLGYCFSGLFFSIVNSICRKFVFMFY